LSIRSNHRQIKTRLLKSRLRQLRLDRKLILSFLRYVCIGGIVFVIGVGTFQLLLLSQLYRPLATTIAYTLAAAVHFTLNKFFNFKNFERSTANQLKTYLVVVVFCWLITLLVVETSVYWLGLSPLWAMILSIIVNIPVGFIGHKYFTFGAGFKPALQRWKRSRRGRQ
jgi:putative flippase GtrA